MSKEYKNPFLAIFILWYTTEIIFSTTLEKIAGIPIGKINIFMSYVILAFLLFQIIFFQKYTTKQLALIVVITFFISISAILSSNFSVISAWLFVVAAKETKFEKVIKTAYRILLVMIPFVIVLHYLGVMDDYIMYRHGILRHSLGFSHPNQLGLRLFQLLACRCYLYKDNYKLIDFLFAFFLISVTYLIPNSQTAYMCMAVLKLLLWGYAFIKRFGTRFVEFYMNCLVILSIAFNVLSVKWSFIEITNGTMLQKIDKIMSIRFSSCHRVLQLYGVTLFGNHIYVNSAERKLVGITTRLFLDNAYMNLILRFGIIIYIIFSISYIASMMYFGNMKQPVLVILFTVYALYGVMEAGLYMMTHNIFLLAISYFLYSKQYCFANRGVIYRKIVFKFHKRRE